MRILMYMPTRNVYVSDSDIPLFDRAAELAGGMSSAVAAGLRLYVTERERELAEMKVVEVEVDDGPVVTVKRFRGSQVLRYETRGGLRALSFRIFATAKGQYAVYFRDDPDWSRLSSPREDDPVWENPGTWDGTWWETNRRSLHVFPDLASMEGKLPAEVINALIKAEAQPGVEELDI
jgi:EXLDI family protein